MQASWGAVSRGEVGGSLRLPSVPRHRYRHCQRGIASSCTEAREAAEAARGMAYEKKVHTARVVVHSGPTATCSQGGVVGTSFSEADL